MNRFKYASPGGVDQLCLCLRARISSSNFGVGSRLCLACKGEI